MKYQHVLSAIPVVSLHKHDLLRNKSALFRRAETNNASNTRVSLLVSMRHTHATADADVEALQLAILADNGNETEIIGEHVDVVCGWYGNSDFEL